MWLKDIIHNAVDNHSIDAEMIVCSLVKNRHTTSLDSTSVGVKPTAIVGTEAFGWPSTVIDFELIRIAWEE